MATASPVYDDRGMSIGRVFQRAFSTIGHNPGVVLTIVVLVGVIPSVLMNFATRSLTGGDPAAAVNNMSAFWGAMLFAWIIAVVIGALVQGALTRATVADSEGQRATFGECIAAALRVLLPLIGVGLIFGIAIGLGFVLLIVPGIIIMVMWSVAGPAVVVERDGVMSAFSRSSELTKGSRWKIFGLFLVLLVIYLLVFMLLGAVGLRSAAAQPLGTANLIFSAITSIVLNLLWGTIQPSLYLELRQAKEGGSLENLSRVFA
jgi:hypothetical protein